MMVTVTGYTFRLLLQIVCLLCCIITTGSVRLKILTPTNHSITSSVVKLSAQIDISPDYDYSVLDSIALCLQYESNDVCVSVNALTFRAFLLLSHSHLSTTVAVALCRIDGDVKNHTIEDCHNSPVMYDSTTILLYAPDVKLSSLIVESASLFENREYIAPQSRPAGLMISFSSSPSTLAFVLGMTSDVFALMPNRKDCAHISAASISCCSLATPYPCMPVVVDFAVIFIDSSPVSENHMGVVTRFLKRVHGKLVIVSSLSPRDTIQLLPSTFTSKLRFYLISNIPNDLMMPHFDTYITSDLSNIWSTGIRSSSVSSLYVSELASSASFSFNHGINIATLRNVCVLPNLTSILLVRPPDSDPILSPSLKHTLNQWNSGFFSTDEIGGWKFIESTPDDMKRSIEYSKPATYVSGVSVGFSPPFYPHIGHLCQTLFNLIHAASHVDLYPWITRMSNLFFPTVSRHDDSWTQSIVSHVLLFVSETTKQSNHNEKGSYISPVVYHREDMAPMFLTKSNNDKSVICFEELILCGTMELSMPLLSSHDEAAAFREFVYSIHGLSFSSRTDFKLHDSIEAPRHGSMKEDTYVPPGTQYINFDGNVSDRAKIPTKNRLWPLKNPIKLTLLLRSYNRWILNLAEMIEMIRATGVIDMEWLESHIILLNDMPFSEQVAIMRETDILLSPHDAGLMNMVFLAPHSAVIEVHTSPWYELSNQGTALASQLHYFVVPQTEPNRSARCEYPPECLDMNYQDREDFRCLGIRGCSVDVDVDAVEVYLWQAIQVVKIMKWGLHYNRVYNARP